MSTAAVISAQPGDQPAPGAPPAAVKRRGFRLFTIGFKFALFSVLLIAAVMAAVGYSLYAQQRAALTREVVGRGRTIAENLSVAARENLGDLLNLSLLANKAVQRGDAGVEAETSEAERWLLGLKNAFNDLQSDVPRVIERSASQLAGQPLNWGFDLPRPAVPSMENEGVYEAIIVDEAGTVLSHYAGTEHVGRPFQRPAIVKQATEETPFPIYEQAYDAGGRSQVRKLFLIEQPIELIDPDSGAKVPKGTVYLGMAEDLVSKLVFKVLLKLVAIAITAVIIGIVFTYVFVSVLTRPLGRLGKGVLAIADGNFDTQVPVSSRDELGELTHAFNNMAVGLSQNKMLQGAFTRYVSDAALKQILADPGKTGLHSQRVLATIYTSDVRGFTAMSETLEPEQVVQIINTYLSLQTEIILTHGGVVDKFIGDATIGVWGKETAKPDDAINAVRAAFDAQTAIEKMNIERAARGEVVKQIGIGVNTGEVVSGNMGSSKKMEYTVTGEHVIFADQICAECPGGKVWISESTYEVVKDQVIVEKLEMKSKGHGDHGTTVYQVNGFK